MLNRITSAEEKTGAAVNWNQTYTFDRYGNRNFNESLTTTLPKGCVDGSTMVVCEADKKMFNPDLNASDNRMAAGQGWAYDAAGNVIADPQGRSFIYDAENKQVEVENSLEQSIGSYWFDGDGKRIKKEGLAPNGQPELTVFVYNAGGTLIGEYSTAIETAAPKVQYLTADHLGSPRINTDQNGTVTSRTDFMPYGEEITALGNRTANENYVSDSVRQGFIGYESDNETGLEFAQARMYGSKHGRFTGFDPVFVTLERLVDPQRLHLYVYSRNSPLKYKDPDGRDVVIAGTDEEKARKEYELFLMGLDPKDRKKVNFFVGDGKNGYKKGAFYILVDETHKSMSENFSALQKAANNRDDIVKATVLKNGDSYSISSYYLEENKEVLGTHTGEFQNDFGGYTLFQLRDGDTSSMYSTGPYTEMLISREQSDTLIAETFFHELRAHVLLGDYGRSIGKGNHSPSCAENSAKCSPTNAADKEGRKAEEEARKNARKKN
ncbi:MAG: hypothetical protein KF831_14495 [Acidobacteria bacterium]|nr:hypothetical protein [Acidobacteriota bacterium]